MQKPLEGQRLSDLRRAGLKPEGSGLSPESLEGWCLLWTDVMEGAVGHHQADLFPQVPPCVLPHGAAGLGAVPGFVGAGPGRHFNGRAFREREPANSRCTL